MTSCQWERGRSLSSLFVVIKPPAPTSAHKLTNTPDIFVGRRRRSRCPSDCLQKEPAPETLSYTVFLCAVLSIALLTAPAQMLWSGVRRWRENIHPILAATALLLCFWEIITSGLRLLPLPYFPSPAKVLQSLIIDRGLLFDRTWHSLHSVDQWIRSWGVVAGLISGIFIGWSSPIRYWGMPVLKVVGPIPATAWIPLAMVVSPSAVVSAAALIALAVWFPVTMLTACGVSYTRASYLDVARTLGAGRWYLIFRVAIPAAVPNIFIGLFMGLGASFLTLVVAETVGVKSGLGWYVSWV